MTTREAELLEEMRRRPGDEGPVRANITLAPELPRGALMRAHPRYRKGPSPSRRRRGSPPVTWSDGTRSGRR